MSNKEILGELEEKFKTMKKELGFRASLDELDEAFFVRDALLSARFVSEKLSRQICSRIIETYMVWTNYLHSLIMPNPGHMLNMNESKMFNEEEKRALLGLLSKSMELTSRNNLIGLTKDKKEEAKFIDNALNFWVKSFKPEMIKVVTKINENWKSN
ncbi:hypothetical protein A3K73_09205 [Candidatus Pacearchaeota archaeon RBG_13_36_9]|nr:MAG: hypothetical protein A3K73_09205 [Candidatus Pacearchaeota archaeon RBG_13_36_9]